MIILLYCPVLINFNFVVLFTHVFLYSCKTSKRRKWQARGANSQTQVIFHLMWPDQIFSAAQRKHQCWQYDVTCDWYFGEEKLVDTEKLFCLFFQSWSYFKKDIKIVVFFSSDLWTSANLWGHWNWTERNGMRYIVNISNSTNGPNSTVV